MTLSTTVVVVVSGSICVGTLLSKMESSEYVCMVCQACGYLRSFHQMALQVCVCCWQDISRVAAYSPVQAVVSLSASLPAHGILLRLSTQGC